MSHPKQTQLRVALLAGLLLAVFYFGLQFSTSRIIENDGHFHIRYSNLMLERGIPSRLPELRYTIWNDSYRDHHFLFHALLIPFSLLPDLTLGAKTAAAFGVAGIGGVLIASNFVISTQVDDTYRCYMDAGKWMDKNIQRGETVFPSDWDDFPMLYLNAPRVRYVVGMDPLFMLEHDKAMYEEYCNITRGIQEGPYSPVIRDRFDAAYVFTDTQHGDFLSVFDKEPGVFRVFSQPQCRIYRIGAR